MLYFFGTTRSSIDLNCPGFIGEHKINLARNHDTHSISRVGRKSREDRAVLKPV